MGEKRDQFKFANGVVVRDEVTSFHGRITGRVDYVTGCRQYLVQPTVKADGEWVEQRWFDEDRLTVVRGGSTLTLPQTNDGPDRSAPTK